MTELPKSRPSRIQALTEKGHWGSATLHSLLSHQAKNQPGALAVADEEAYLYAEEFWVDGDEVDGVYSPRSSEVEPDL